MPDRESSINTIREFVTECNKINLLISKAILFGSVASGTATPYSDIDVALFSDQFTNNILENLDLIGAVNIRYPEIEVHPYPTSQYSQDSFMMDEIRQKGINIPF